MKSRGRKGKEVIVLLMTYMTYMTPPQTVLLGWQLLFLLLLDNAMYQDVFVAFSLALVATIFRHTSVSSTYPCPCVGR